MNESEGIILSSLNEVPIGETDNFIWYITVIGIAALYKGDGEIKDVDIEKEGCYIAIDLSKEEKEFYTIKGKRVVLFFS
tara:strand:+ start:24 stop:260 length:237 start_codon:yes stop_codon:yes gene_type:complete